MCSALLFFIKINCVIAFVISLIIGCYLRILIVRLKHKLKTTDVLNLFINNKHEIQTLFLEHSKKFLQKEDTQKLIKQQIDTFIKKEFSIIASFIGVLLLEKLKNRLIAEIINMLEEIKDDTHPAINNIFFRANTIIKLKLITHINLWKKKYLLFYEIILFVILLLIGGSFIFIVFMYLLTATTQAHILTNMGILFFLLVFIFATTMFLFTNFIRKRINNKLSKTIPLALLVGSCVEVENIIFNNIESYLIQPETQQMIKQRVDTFIKKEFTIVANLLGKNLLDKLASHVTTEISILLKLIKNNPTDNTIQQLISIVYTNINNNIYKYLAQYQRRYMIKLIVAFILILCFIGYSNFSTLKFILINNLNFKF